MSDSPGSVIVSTSGPEGSRSHDGGYKDLDQEQMLYLWNILSDSISNSSNVYRSQIDHLSNTSEWANYSGYEEPETADGLQFWTLCLLLFPLWTVFGNVLVCLSVYRERSLQTVTNYFIVSLAIADIMVAMLVMPFAVYVEVNNGEWMLGDASCDAWVAFDVMCCTASILNLTAISVDRYIAVTQPIKYAKHKNSKRVYVMLALTWVISLAISSPIALGMNYTERRAQTPSLCTFYNSDFLIFSSMGSFYIPGIVMLLLYWRIFRAIRLRARRSSVIVQKKVTKNLTTPEVVAAAAAATGNGTRQRDLATNQLPKRPTGRVSLCGDLNPPKCPAGSLQNVGPGRGLTARFSLPVTEEEVSVVVGEKLSSSYKHPNLQLLQPEVLRQGASGDTGNHDGSVSTDGVIMKDCIVESVENENTQTASSKMASSMATVSEVPVSTRTTSDVGNSNVSDGVLSLMPSSQRNPDIVSPAVNNEQVVGNSSPTSPDRSPSEPPDNKSDSKPKFNSKTTANCNRNHVTGSGVPTTGGSGSRNRKLSIRKITKFEFRLNSQAPTAKSKKDKSNHRRERKATQTLAIVLGVFLLCWVPFFTINIINAVCIRYDLFSSSICRIDPILFSFFVWLGYMNSFLNPVIYTIFNTEFRRAFNRILRRPCG